MEDTSGPVIQTPFGEGAVSELISHWLDEGDRLSASAAEIAAPAPPPESRLRRVFQRLQPVVARHRLFVFAGIGLLPLVLILSTQRRAPAQPPAATVPLTLPVAAPAISETRPAPSARAHTPPAPTLPTPTPTPTSVTTTVPPATETLASAGSFEPAPPRHHHHHHHHHATSAPVRAVAPAGHATRR